MGEDQWPSAVRQEMNNRMNVVDFGFQCPKCKSEFGFERHGPVIKREVKL